MREVLRESLVKWAWLEQWFVSVGEMEVAPPVSIEIPTQVRQRMNRLVDECHAPDVSRPEREFIRGKLDRFVVENHLTRRALIVSEQSCYDQRSRSEAIRHDAR